MEVRREGNTKLLPSLKNLFWNFQKASECCQLKAFLQFPGKVIKKEGKKGDRLSSDADWAVLIYRKKAEKWEINESLLCSASPSDWWKLFVGFLGVFLHSCWPKNPNSKNQGPKIPTCAWWAPARKRQNNTRVDRKICTFFLQMALRLGGVPAALLNFSLQVNKSNLAQCWFHRCWQEDPAVYPRKVGNNENFLLRSQSCPLSFINPLSINYPHFLSSPPRGHCSSSAMLPNGFCLQGFSLTRNSCF